MVAFPRLKRDHGNPAVSEAEGLDATDGDVDGAPGEAGCAGGEADARFFGGVLQPRTSASRKPIQPKYAVASTKKNESIVLRDMPG